MSSGMVQSSNSSQQEKEQSRPGEVTRPRMVQRLLSAGDDLPAFLQDLVNAQTMVAGGNEGAAFLADRNENVYRLVPMVHIRPDQPSDEVRKAALTAFQQILLPCVEQNREGAFEVGKPDDTGEAQFCLATVLRSEGQVVGVSAVIARCQGMDRARQRLAGMEMVAGYFEVLAIRRSMLTAQQMALSHQGVLQLIGSVATVDGFESGAKNICNELATRTGAARVAIGWRKGEQIKLTAMSHTEKFDKRQELPTAIVRVMEECLDQEQVVHYDPTGGGTDTVSREAASYARMNANCAVVCVPLRRMNEVVGILMLEFAADHKPDRQAMEVVAIAGDVLAPQLYDRYENDRNIFVKMGGSIKHFSQATVGPKYTLAKIIVAAVIVVLGVLIFYQPVYRVSTPFAFTADDKRSVVAPAEGYIDKLGIVNGELVRPGMRVKAGDVLVEMDTTELNLKRNDALTRANALQKEADQKLTEPGKTAEAMVALEQKKAAMAQADLLSWQIEHATVRSPIDGEILRGDLRDKRNGFPVKEGDPLFEIAALKTLEVEMDVAERDIQMVKAGQKGQFATSSEPSRSYPFVVERIVPLGEPKEGANVFKVYGKIDGQIAPEWKPGMVGEARISTEPARVIWIWTHRLTDLLRLKLWW